MRLLSMIPFLGFCLTSSWAVADLFMPEGELDALERGWTPWVKLDNQRIESDPAACYVGETLWLVARAPDRSVIYNTRNQVNGQWSGWKSFGGRITGSPAVVCGVDTPHNWSRWDVYAQGGDQAIWHRWDSFDHTSNWENLEGYVAGSTGPAAVTNSLRRQDIFYQGAWDRQVWWRTFQVGGGWSQWRTIPGMKIQSDPAATWSASNRLELFGVSLDGRLKQNTNENGRWQSWTDLAGGVTSSPEVVSTGTGSMDLFIRGSNYELLHKHWTNGVWGQWENLGGYLTSGPGATTYVTSRIMVFVRGGDGNVYYRAWAPR